MAPPGQKATDRDALISMVKRAAFHEDSWIVDQITKQLYNMYLKQEHFPISPTGLGVRSDQAGDGRYGAPRGDRTHKGTDFLCDPGQDVIAPITGEIRRERFPYADDLSYKGCVIVGEIMTITLFYMALDKTLIVTHVNQGQVIGKAQDVSLRYPDSGMLAHVHMQIDEITIDPAQYMAIG